jgi:4-amino-4-deoxy-L-arabinose transferase-like glycosyltransferase
MLTRQRLVELAALLIVLILAAYLRLANVATNPAWYTDEGTHLDIARHLLQGKVQYLAIDQSWLLVSRLPLFEVLLTALATINGVNMETLRTLTGSLGVVTVAVLYGVLWRIQRGRDRWLPLLAALLLAIYPPAVLYSRFGFSYNLLAPLILIVLLALWECTSSRSKHWLAVASLSIGLGTLCDLWMFVMLMPFALIVLLYHWRDLLWCLPLTLLPFGFYVVVMSITVPSAFWFDLRFVLSRLNQLPLDRQVATLAQNAIVLAQQDAWMWLSVIGLLLLKPSQLCGIALALFVIPIVLLGRTTALFSLSFYYLIPLLPFVALGVASLIRYGVPQVVGWMLKPPQADRVVALVALIIAAILSISTATLIDHVRNGFHTDIDAFLLNPADAMQTAQYINAQMQSDDVVIASPTLAWALNARVADMQLPLAYASHATPHFPANIPAERWSFNPAYQQARFVIVDNLWHNWAVPNVAGVAEMVHEVETWPVAFRASEVAVYQNPVR